MTKVGNKRKALEEKLKRKVGSQYKWEDLALCTVRGKLVLSVLLVLILGVVGFGLL